MNVLETSKYSKWYKSHRRFSFTAKHCIELYEEKQRIPDSIFKSFLKSVYCHSKSEEKMFADMINKEKIFEEHAKIIPSKQYTDEEKYIFCKSLLLHMKEEEDMITKIIKTT